MDVKEGLQRVEELALGSKIARLKAQPLKYLLGMAFMKIIYPFTKKGVIVQTRTFFGANLQLVLPSGMDIFLTGGKSHASEIRLARFMINTLKEGEQFMDVGAHLGYFSTLAAHLVGASGKVIAFEASKNTFVFLSKNLQNLPQANCLNQAVSDEKGVLSFYEFPILYSEYNTLEIKQFERESWYAKNKPSKANVATIPMDEFIAQNHLQPNLIKIDVEGAEYRVLLGMQNFLKTTFKCPIVMEYLSAERHNTAHQDAANLLRAMGYESFIIDREGKLLAVPDLNKYLLRNNLESDNIVFQKNQPC
jgi:FkbM family methyltransferase